MKAKFQVSLNIPQHTTAAEMADYIRQAVRCWCGSKDPEDPLYYLDKKSVTVKQIKKSLASSSSACQQQHATETYDAVGKSVDDDRWKGE